MTAKVLSNAPLAVGSHASPSGTRTSQARPSLPGDTVRMEIVFACALVLSVWLLGTRPVLVAVVLLGLGGAVLRTRRSMRLAACYGIGAVIGTATGLLLTHLGVWTHGEPTAFGVAIWLSAGSGLASVLLLRLAGSGVRHSDDPWPREAEPTAVTAAAEPFIDRKPRVCAIVAARNEAASVGDVVRALRATPSVGEVLVVDNASSDRTGEEARRNGARVVTESRVGKGEAMARGAAVTDAEILVFVDADLIGLNASHVEVLVASVASGESDMACGLWDRGRFWNWVLCHLVPIVTGQRAVRRTLFTSLPPKVASGYRVEAALNAHVARLGGRRVQCILSGLGHHAMTDKVASRLRGALHVARVSRVASWTALTARVLPRPLPVDPLVVAAHLRERGAAEQ